METEKIVRGYDSKIFRRLFAYIRPYSGPFLLALGGLILATLGELATPVLLQRAMDRHILVEYSSFITPEAETTTDPAPGSPGPPAEPLAALVLSRTSEPSYRLGNRIFVLSSALGELSGAQREDLLARGVLDPGAWYLFPANPSPGAAGAGAYEADGGTAGEAGADISVSELSEKYPGLFGFGEGFGVILKEDLGQLSRDDLRAIRGEDFRGIRRYSFFYLLLLGGILIFSFLQVYIMTFISQKVMKDMRLELLGHSFGQSLRFFGSRPLGTLVSRVTSDVETVNELFTSVATSLFRDVFVMAGVIFVLFSMNARLAMITVLTLPPVLVMSLIFRHQARKAYRQVRLWISNVNGFLSEHIAGMEIVQMFGREKRSRREFAEKSRSLLRANLGEMYVFATFRPLIDFFTSVSTGVILYFGARAFTSSALTLGVLIAFVNLVGQFYRPMMDIAEKFNILQSAMAGSERVFDLLDTDTKIPDTGDLSAEGLAGEVEFRDVLFSYNPDEPVLKGLSFRINPGETVAVVGFTGAGKTTIANLLARFWDIQGGEILLDGRPINSYALASLRENIQTVQQDVFLFSGTLGENISLGKPMAPEELEAAAAAVQADRFIRRLPGGFEYQVKEGGANLSAGQRQLISFARIIAHNPRLVILDEATASVDTRTEKLIQAGLREVLKGRTSLVIAHRLSTIRNADRILVLNQGRLAEEGTHEQLLGSRGAYYNLYQLQYQELLHEE